MRETAVSDSSLSDTAVAAQYRATAAAYARDVERAAERSERIGGFRIAAFAAAVLALVWTATAAAPLRPVAGALTLVLALVFAALVRWHRRERRMRERYEHARLYHELGALRVARDWAALPIPAAPELPPTHPYAADLNITGRASLLQLLDVVSAAPGRTTLLTWLLAPAPSAEEIAERQRAVRELLAMPELREELGILARMANEREARPASLERFIDWCERPPWLLERPALLWAARALAALTVALLVLQAIGIVPWPAWLLSAALGGAFTRAVRRGVQPAIAATESRATLLRHHAAMLQLFAATPFATPRLARIRAHLEAGGGAPRQLARLERIVAWAEVRYSPMLHGALQWLVLWDVHVAAALEHWRREAGAHVRDWLTQLGEAEALAAFATLAHDNPTWCVPELVQGGEARVDGSAVAHPLLPAATRVANDVTVGPPGSVLLITGSNMSGKSTLLRAVGTNVVLALAGAPVCAARLRLPRLAVYTSMRVQDSLEAGISLFMAELHRLKQIVDAARTAPPDCPVLYLLDEILHGTNSAERRVAARTVIGHLLRAGAIGAVTTHDLALAADGALAAAARPVHFTEHFDETPSGTAMRFDYRLRPGLATSANALALLDLVGLGDRARE